MSSRRRRGPSLITIYWRDIPAQVNGVDGHEKTQVVLKRRFQRSIDQAAMAAGITTASDYVKQWRRVTEPAAGGDVGELAQRRAEAIDEEFPSERLRDIAERGGWDEVNETISDHTGDLT